jgi:hypothetical protein
LNPTASSFQKSGVTKILQPVFTHFCTKQFFMEHSAFINLDLLSPEARKELETFYEFLLFKYRKNKKKQNEDSSEKANQFKDFADKHLISLPGDYTFNREEANER